MILTIVCWLVFAAAIFLIVGNMSDGAQIRLEFILTEMFGLRENVLAMNRDLARGMLLAVGWKWNLTTQIVGCFLPRMAHSTVNFWPFIFFKIKFF